MTNREFEILYKKTCLEVADKALNAALLNIKLMIAELTNPYFEDQRQEIENTYLNMLNYVINAVPDPEQESIYNKIQIRTLELADAVRDTFFTKESNNIVYQQKRTSSVLHINLPQDTYQTLEHLPKIFQRLWLTDKYQTDFTEQVKALFSNSFISNMDKSAFVSAITLALIRTFDMDKFHILLDLINHESKDVKQRALIGLIFCTNIHYQRIPLYKQLNSRINFIFQEESMAENLQNTIIQILLSNETNKITKKMNEAIPDLMKDVPLEEMRKNRLNITDFINEENEMSITNPKWKSIIENTSFSDKMMELSQLQIEGGDIFMSTFSSLKNYPFFNTIENWFLPFFCQEIAQKYPTPNNDSKLPELLKTSIFLCNSDKYSMFYSIGQMPANYLDMMQETFQMEKEQLNEMKNDQNMLDKYSEEKIFARMYIQDLFRFYNIYIYKNDFSNPFLSIKEFPNNLLIRNNPKSLTIILAISDFYIKKEYYQQAIQLLQSIEKDHPTDLDIIQKIAYCHQQLKDYSKAITYYEKAETIQSNTLWNLQHLAYCKKCMKDYEGCLETYRACELLSPEDLNIQSNIGSCLINLQRYQEALKIFFKIEYLAPEDNRAAKAIGWCSFVCNKLEQAEKYYLKTDEKKRNISDWMNIGHIQLCQNKREEAIRSYQKAYLMIEKDPRKFENLFIEDKTHLINNGLSQENLSLICDYILYKIEELQ
ncbi:MAG: tetratricopeptide repeat protein [Paludibacteraceae bacterium]|nr:tetratricopeptide repeat protein [Paludibacteraceae bacterium]